MNRIVDVLGKLRARKCRALIGYLTAGDPDLKTSERNIRVALKHGVDLLELGVPFSDPTADGSVIQAAGRRALAAGVNLKQILALAARLRKSFDTPIVLFSYANPLFRYGYEALCRDAARAGIDGILVVDLPDEEAGELRCFMRRHGLLFIQLIAPTTPPARVRQLLARAEGFVYYVLVKGVTGARKSLGLDLRRRIEVLRGCTRLPVAAGFGIRNGAQAREVARYADAVVVGSALVEAAHERRLAALTHELADAVHHVAGARRGRKVLK